MYCERCGSIIESDENFCQCAEKNPISQVVKGSFVLKTLEGEKLEIAPSKIMLLGHQAACITERRTALLPAL